MKSENSNIHDGDNISNNQNAKTENPSVSESLDDEEEDESYQADSNNASSTQLGENTGTATDSAAIKRKRTTIDESTLNADDLQKLESRRAYNRHCAAKARKRSKTLVAQLQAQVEELTKDKAELKRSNDLMRTQLDLLEQQNRTLLMNQLSSQLPQLNANNLLAGNNLGGNGLVPNAGNMGQTPGANVQNHMFNSLVGSNAPAGGGGSASGGTGNINSSLGSFSLLDRVRLQQQLQLQQHQLALASSANAPGNRDLMLNGLRNNSNNNTNFLG